jgi:hypothetical protein
MPPPRRFITERRASMPKLLVATRPISILRGWRDSGTATGPGRHAVQASDGSFSLPQAGVVPIAALDGAVVSRHARTGEVTMRF